MIAGLFFLILDPTCKIGDCIIYDTLGISRISSYVSYM